MKTLTAALLLTAAATAQGEVFIYNQAYTQTATGLGTTQVHKWTGYFFFDNSGGFMQIDVNKAAKTFRVYDYSTWNWDLYYPNLATSYQMVISLQPSASDFGMVYGKGPASSTFVGTTNYNIAKTMTLGGSWTKHSGGDLLFEFKGKLTFDSADTIASNVASWSGVANALPILTSNLTSQGYTQEN